MKTVFLKIFTLLIVLFQVSASHAQVSGKITVNKDFYDALKVMHGGSLLKTALLLEVWTVKYFDVQIEVNGAKSVVTRIYLQEKWSGTNIPLTEEPAGDKVNLKFSIKNLPGGSKYALVYSLSDYPDLYKTVRFDQRASDGSGRLNLRYQGNFSTKIGAKKALGLYSISGKSQVYDINLFSSTQVVAFGALDFIGDFFEDAADLIWEGGKFLAGVVVDATGTILAQAYGMAQALVLDDGVIIPRYRELTANEYTFVNTKIFKYTLPPRDKIIVTNLLGLSKRPFTWATGVDGKIMMNLGKKGYDNNAASVLGFYANGELPGQILIHEMAHVWQLHHSENISFDLQSLKNQVCNFFSDQYTYQCGLAWNDYNLEQQAKIVEHCFFKREKLIASNCEEPYVVANIREGVSFRTPECQKLVDDIAAKTKEINKRIDELKVAWLIEQGETVVMNADGTIKVGSDKGIGSVSVPSSVLNSDSRLTQLKAELAVLEQRRAATNCR